MKKIFILSVLFLYSFISFADLTDTLTTNANELKFSIKNNYDVVSIEDGFYTKVVGAPQLPVKIVRLVIPLDKKVSNVVINSTNSQQLSGIYTIYPAQNTHYNDSIIPPPFDQPDIQIYNSNSPYPGNLVQILDDQYPMGYHVVSLIFYPLQYLPSSKILKLYTQINFTLIYENSSENIILPNLQSQLSYNISKGYIESIIKNTDDLNTVTGGAKEVINISNNLNLNLKSMPPSNISFIPDYIIITDPAFVSSFQPLADWKIQKGVYTIVVSTTDIYTNYQGCDNAEKIRNYLKEVKKNFGSTYVLLGGDVEYVPTRFAAYFEADYYYATIEGNWNANGNSLFSEDGEIIPSEMSMAFYVGRAPVKTIAQVNNFVNKVIHYEKMDIPLNLNYLKNISFLANYSNNNYQILNSIDHTSGGFIIPSEYPILKLYTNYSSHIDDPIYSTSSNNRYFDFNSLNVLNSLKTGWNTFGQTYGNIHLFFHHNHSSSEAIGINSESINRINIDALTSNNYYQIFYSDGCNTNEFSLDAVSEHYINKINGGGVAYLGNSYSGYEDDCIYFKTFCQVLYDKLKINPYYNKYYHIGFANYQTVFPLDPLNLYYRMKNRNLLGDPEMVVWTDAPKTLTVTTSTLVNKQITVNISGIDVSNAPGNAVVVSICLYKANEIYQISENTRTDNNSFLQPFTDIDPDTPGDIHITVTAQNYLPKQIIIPVSINAPHPYMSDLQIKDEDVLPGIGNNDAKADAGETIKLPITLRNSDNTPNAFASNVVATLTFLPKNLQSGTMITFPNNAVSVSLTYGSINSGASVTNTFVFNISKDAFEGITPRPRTQYARFKLEITYGNNESITKTFEIEITEPLIKKGEHIITEDLITIGLKHININLYNMGLSQATDITAELSNSSSNISISPSTQPNYDINSNSIVSIPFEFTINHTQYSGEEFGLYVKNRFDKELYYFFSLAKPIIKIDYPFPTFLSHTGYETSIMLNWNVVLTFSQISIEGYNIYRSENLNGNYQKVNTNLIHYLFYLDEGLQLLTPYYYKISAVDVNGNESDQYPASGYPASTTLPYHLGWPVMKDIRNLGLTANGSPNVIDVDGDGEKEIFFSTGSSTGTIGGNEGGLWAFKPSGDSWFRLDPNAGEYSGFVNFQCDNQATPAIADINGDGKYEIAATTGLATNNTNSEKLFIYSTTEDTNNDQIPDEVFPPKNIGNYPVRGVVLSDINNDNKQEIITNYLNGGIKIFNYSGSLINTIDNFKSGYSMPVAFDFDDDGVKEIVSGSVGSGINIWRIDGSPFSSNPVYTPLFVNYRADFPPVICDINNDTKYEIIFITAKDKDACVCIMDEYGAILSGWEETNSNHHITLTESVTTSNSNNIENGRFGPNLVVGDVDRNGDIEIVIGSNNTLHIFNKDGTVLKTITIPSTTTSPSTYSSAQKAPIIADIDTVHNDMEIIITDDNIPAKIYAYKYNGDLVNSFPIILPGNTISTLASPIQNTPCIADIDNDGKNEIFISTGTRFYLWDTQGLGYLNDWGAYRHDANNSGVFINNCYFSNTPLEINGNEQWDGLKIINSIVNVNSGANLVINGTVRLSEQSKIIVKPGGKLILNGSALTSLCPNKMWRGIEVWGTSDKPQESSFADPHQGIVQIINGSIEHAENAITLWHPGDWQSMGGIVYANGATFLNNRRSVEFMAYENKLPGNIPFRNLSSFDNCTFKVDHFYRGKNTNPFAQHVTLWGVNGVFFTACTFLNEQSNKVYSLTNNKAIFSLDAGYTVRGSCPAFQSDGSPCSDFNIVKSYFKGFNTALDAKASGTLNAVKVENAVFDENVTGVKYEGLNNPWINKSEFLIGNSTIANIPVDKFPTGILTIGTQSFRIEENFLHPSSNSTSNMIGINIINSDAINNQVYKNKSQELPIAVKAVGKNNSIDKISGLQILCNEHINNTNDISITAISSIQNNGIRFNQGSPAVPPAIPSISAGNEFSANGNDIENTSGSKIVYLYTQGITEPQSYTPVMVQIDEADIENTCPSMGYFEPIDNTTMQEFVSQYSVKETSYLNLLYNYNSLIDGGNTNLLLNEIETSWSQYAWDLRAALLANSPYLSQEVLCEAANSDVLPQAMLLEVCLANPDATRSEDFIKFLGEVIPNPLPQYMLDLIIANWEAETPRTLLEGSLASLRSQMDFISGLIIANYMHDTIPNNGEARNWLLRRGDMPDYYSLAESSMESNVFDDAFYYLSQVSELFRLTEEQEAELQNFTDYLSFRQTIYESGRNIMQLNETELESLQQIAGNNTGKSSVLAQNILCFGYQQCVDYLPEESQNRQMRYTKPTKPAREVINAAYNKITATPNPANVYVEFSWELPLLNGNATLIISDVNGKFIDRTYLSTQRGQWIWDTRSISKGIYFYEVKSDKENLCRGKLVISK